MTQARRVLVDEKQAGFYHCVSRLNRGAFLCGKDHETGKDYSDRKAYIENRLKYLSGIFCVDVCAYAILSNHWHSIIYMNPKRVSELTPMEVAERWLRVFPVRDALGHPIDPPAEVIMALSENTSRIELLRRRLGSISWFMRCVKEPLAKMANREDGVRGHFWQGRFKSIRILSQSALLACSVYIDLNPIRAKLAETPETSEFTSVKNRIMALKAKKPDSDWLCPIEKDRSDPSKSVNPSHPGLFDLSLSRYLSLVDWTGREIRADKRGAIPEEFGEILDRLDLDRTRWLDNIQHIGRRFRSAMGPVSSIMQEARRRGCQWIQGKTSAAQLHCPEKSTDES